MSMNERLALPFIRESRPRKIIAEIANHFLIPSILIEGRENLEKAQELANEQRVKLILTPNHISNADAPVLNRALRENRFGDLADNLVFIQGIKLDRHPINKYFTKAFKVIKIWPQSLPAVTIKEQVERRKIRVRASNDAKKSLQAGYSLVIFPEGGRSEGSLKQADASAIHFFKLDKNWETIALPVGIWGTEKVMPPDKVPRPSLRVHVGFGEPINVSSLIRANSYLGGEQMYRTVIDELMRKGIAPILPLQYRGVYA